MIAPIKPPIRIPRRLRENVFRVCQFGPFRSLASSYYRRVARVCARQLMENTGVKEVYLRGGVLKAFAPGMSDVDFTAVVDDACHLSSAPHIREIQSSYHRLRRHHLVPGELL